MAVAITFAATLSQTAPSGVNLTFSGVSIGTAAADRLIFVVTQTDGGSTDVISSCTIGGVTAAQVTGAAATTSARRTQIWWAAVPTGTTGAIVLQLSANTATNTIGAAVFSVTGADTTTPVPVSNGSASDTKTSGATYTGTLDVPANGGLLVGVFSIGTRGTQTFTWTNATEDQDTGSQTAAHFTTATLQSAYLVTATVAGSVISNGSLSACALQPAGGGGGSSFGPLVNGGSLIGGGLVNHGRLIGRASFAPRLRLAA